MTSPAEPPLSKQSRSTPSRVFGVIMIIVGYLLLTAAGLCTLTFGGMFLASTSANDIGILLLYGGGPMLIGALIAWAGHRLWRSGAGR